MIYDTQPAYSTTTFATARNIQVRIVECRSHYRHTIYSMLPLTAKYSRYYVSVGQTEMVYELQRGLKHQISSIIARHYSPEQVDEYQREISCASPFVL